MDVVHAKQVQFSPVVLTLPGYEQESKQFFKDEPEMWKIYRRLSKTQKPGKGSTSQASCGYIPTTFNIPGKEGLRCMCYEELMRIIREGNFIQPPRQYRYPKSKSLAIGNGIFPTWPKRAMVAYRNNEDLQFPLGTLVVRWQQKRILPLYNKNVIQSIFSKFGHVTDVRILGTNSCLVIFQDICAACNAMQTRNIGEQTNPLHCTWWHQSMANKTVAVRKKGVAVQTNMYLV